MKKILFIIDAYNLIYRMFYAIPEMYTRDGRQVNAIFGTAKFLRWLAEENPQAELVVATDVGQSFRAGMFSEYKAQRDRMPDNLRAQIDGVFSLFRAANIAILEREWYEADDIIGSLVLTCRTDERQIVIISSDKDLCQFVEDGCVHIYDAMKRRFMKRADVIEKFGVPPEQVRDYLAIVGDSSDNIPGVAGFGPKKATDLLSKYGSLEGIYEHLDALTPKMRDTLQSQKDNAFLSKKLATIVTDLSVPLDDNMPRLSALMTNEYKVLLHEYEFRSLMDPDDREVAKKIHIDVTEITSLETLDRVTDTIFTAKKPLTLHVDASMQLTMGFDGRIYRVDTTKVDATRLIDAILDGKIEVVGYDIKSLLKSLHHIKNPPQKEAEGQGRLF